MKKTGLLGGSFDPVHLAHISLAEAARHHLDLAEVQLIPAAQPWQRRPLTADADERLAMLHIAVRDHPQLHINPVEIQRGGTTYTIETLESLAGDIDYYWILGADQLENFCSWHRWQDIARRVHLTVAERPGAKLAPPAALEHYLAEIGRRLIQLPFKAMPVSSTEIRSRLARGEPTEGLLDVAVAQYIEQNDLYAAPVA